MAVSLKDEVLDAVDIVDVIGQRVALKRKGREFVGLCPFHPDKRPSLSVSPTKRIFKCWSCGVGGDVIKFVQLSERVDFRTALHSLAERAGIATHARGDESARAGANQRERLREVLAWATRHFQRNLRGPQGKAALQYARSRGISDETIDRFGVGFARAAWDDLVNTAQRAGVSVAELQLAGLAATSDSGRTYDRFRNRLMLPIRDGQGRCVAFGGRTLGDDPAKYLNSPETALFSKSRILYALDLARPAIQREREAIVVEGYLDAVLLHQAGIDNVVATLGIALTDPH
ncbi:MAG: DNA primase, partial [Planctomycetota bacterium]